MSFAVEVKQEVAGAFAHRVCCMEAELQAITAAAGNLSIVEGAPRLTYRTANIACAKETLLLLKRRFGIVTTPYYVRNERLGGRREYVLQLAQEDSSRVLGALQLTGGRVAGVGRMYRRVCCRRAFIRGAFLAAGTITDPERGYRAEFVLDSAERAAFLIRLLALCDVSALGAVRRGQHVVYVGQGEAVSTLLRLLGASRAVLHLENVRALSAVRQQANRATNFDQANLSRQLSAGQQQADAIEALSLNGGLASMPKDLAELARLRLVNRDATLEQLGAMLNPPLSKSGVQHRMRRVMQFAAQAQNPAE
ncbi:MAG: DNA-binding protein WhiA [Clostridiales bacterium]|nr:DNA-binding protein WhiA [Clostridiales bacterium]